MKTTRRPKIIEGIKLGIAEGKVAWIFQYAHGAQESFALHLGVARQFMQGLQELVLLLEHVAQSPPSSKDGVGVQDTVSMRLSPPPEEEEA